jgi:hypothetical protein
LIVITPRGDDSRHVRAVAVVIHGVPAICDGVNAVDIVDVAVTVVIVPVSGDLSRISPDVACKVGVVEINACICDNDDLSVQSNGRFPCRGELHQSWRVLLWIVRVVGYEVREHRPVR